MNPFIFAHDSRELWNHQLSSTPSKVSLEDASPNLHSDPKVRKYHLTNLECWLWLALIVNVMPLPDAGWVRSCLTIQIWAENDWEMQISSNNSFNSINVHIMNIITRKSAWTISDYMSWTFYCTDGITHSSASENSHLQPTFKFQFQPYWNWLSIFPFALMSRCSAPWPGQVDFSDLWWQPIAHFVSVQPRPRPVNWAHGQRRKNSGRGIHYLSIANARIAAKVF